MAWNISSGLPNPYHGQMVSFAEFQNMCPVRNQFIDSKLAAEIDGQIAVRDRIRFHPNTVEDATVNFKSTMLMIGILMDGRRAIVCVEDIGAYFLVRVPIQSCKSENAIQQFRQQVCSRLNNDSACSRYDIVYGKEASSWQPEDEPYIKLTFPTLGKRSRAINILRKIYDIRHDDLKNYHIVLARDHSLNLAGWNEITNYHIGEIPGYKTPAFFITLNNLHRYEGNVIDDLQLAKEKLLVEAWDIETECKVLTDKPPLPHNREDSIFTICTTFHWRYARDTLLRISLVMYPQASDPNSLVVYCGSEQNLLYAFALVHRQMRPDFTIGYNTSDYDYPWIVQRAYHYGILENMCDIMDECVPQFPDKGHRLKNVSFDAWRAKQVDLPNEDHIQDKYLSHICRWYEYSRTKLEAGLDRHGWSLQFSGTIAIDLLTIFLQLEPKSETGHSLNAMLALNKLGGKDDMPISRMYDTYTRMKSFLAQHGRWPSMANGNEEAKLMQDMKAITDYCIIDSFRCQELQIIRNIIADYREKPVLSYTTTYMGFFRADGMKVRNLVYWMQNQRNLFGSMASREQKGEKEKYPGAFVLEPDKGLCVPKLTFEERLEKYKKHIERFGNVTPSNTYRKVPYPEVALIEKLSEKLAVFKACVLESKGAIYEEAVADEIVAQTEAKLKNLPNALILDPRDKTIFRDFLLEKSGKPIVGLDFESLYPSLMMAYNLTPEKCVSADAYNNPYLYALRLADLKRLGIETHDIEFEFGNAKRKVFGRFVAHKNDIKQMGVFPSILIELKNKRKIMKLPAEYYKIINEYIEVENDKIRKANKDLPAAEQKVYIETIELEKALLVVKHEVDFDKNTGLRVKDVPIESIRKALNFPGKVLTMEDIRFYFNYYDSKQKALKVFMNTMYGESGNQRSAIFLLPVAGAVTTMGQKNILMAKKYVESQEFHVRYIDTDSLYIEGPRACFADLDKQYFGGTITKEQYCAELVLITFKIIDEIKDKVNAVLMKDNGTKYLAMAYEEVLWPVLFAAKKKYYGIPHYGKPNFFPKKLFIRGFDVIKRGVAKVMKNLADKLMRKTLNISCIDEPLEIAYDTIDEFCNQQWDPKLFIKTIRYKPVSLKQLEMGRGNKAVLTFVRRMKARGVEVPPHEKFDYVIVKTDTFHYTERGNSVKYSAGDKYEFIDYAIANHLPIDIEYYVQAGLLASLARVAIYRPEFFAEAIDDTDEELKKASQAMYDMAYDHLLLYSKQYFDKDPNYGGVYRAGYTESQQIVNTRLGIDKEVAKTLGKNWDFSDPSAFVRGLCDRIRKSVKGKLGREKYGREGARILILDVNNPERDNILGKDQKALRRAETEFESIYHRIVTEASKIFGTIRMAMKTYTETVGKVSSIIRAALDVNELETEGRARFKKIDYLELKASADLDQQQIDSAIVPSTYDAQMTKYVVDCIVQMEDWLRASITKVESIQAIMKAYPAVQLEMTKTRSAYMIRDPEEIAAQTNSDLAALVANNPLGL